MAATSNIVVIFDFDKTIIDCDSDNWVVNELGATYLFNQLLPTMPWNTLMDTMMNKLHTQGITINDIVDVLKRTPIHPRIVSAIKSAHAFGCDLKIVSDANMFFIETILEHHGLKNYFSEIHTNPSFVDKEGRLRISPHHNFTKSSHDCPNMCPPNMCKGSVIEKIRDSFSSKANNKMKKFIYLGDGVGDFCPSLNLDFGDFLMPRKDFPVWKLVCENTIRIKAKIHEWRNGEDLGKVLLNLISDIIMLTEDIENTTNKKFISSIDYNLKNIAVGTHDAFSQAVSILR